MSIVDQIIEDLVKGAQASEGFVRGSRANVEIQRHGEEQKLANHAGLGAGLGAASMLPFGGAIGGALGADDGHRADAALGGTLGGLGGATLGAAGGAGLGALLHMNPALLKDLAMVGGVGGNVAGSAYGASKMSAVSDAYATGVKTATTRFGIKEAFLGALMPLLGSVAGPSLARAGAARFAPGLAQAASKGLGSHAFDMGASMLGGAAGQHLAGPQQA